MYVCMLKSQLCCSSSKEHPLCNEMLVKKVVGYWSEVLKFVVAVAVQSMMMMMTWLMLTMPLMTVSLISQPVIP